MAKSKNPRLNAAITFEAFEWNAPYSVLINNLGFGKELNLEAAKIFYRWYRPYIPYKSGKLTKMVHFRSTRDHGTITHYAYDTRYGGVGYKYAPHQYTLHPGPDYDDMSIRRTRTVHRLATSHWDHWAWVNHKKEITADIREARLKYRKPTRSKRK